MEAREAADEAKAAVAAATPSPKAGATPGYGNWQYWLITVAGQLEPATLLVFCTTTCGTFYRTPAGYTVDIYRTACGHVIRISWQRGTPPPLLTHYQTGL